MGVLGDLLRARFLPGVQAAAMAPFAAQAQGLLGKAATPYEMSDQELFPGEAPIQGLGTAGSGLLADPTNIGNQMKFGLGMAALPGYGSFGTDVMRQGLMQQLGLPMQQAAMGLDAMKANQGTSAMRNMAAAGFQPGSPQYQGAMREYMMKPQSVVNNNVGGVPGGAVREDLPGGGQGIRYLPGSKEHTSAVDEVQSLDRSLENLDLLQDMVEKHGTEAWGPQSAEMGILYSNLQTTMAQLYEKGVLQKEELENLESVLPNPTDIGAGMTTNRSILASYKAAADSLERKARDAARKYSGWGIQRGYERKARGGTQAQPRPAPPVPDNWVRLR